MNSVITIDSLNKVYDDGFEALRDINLDIRKGEIFALLGPNGAGKTTLISIICGLVQPSSGVVHANGYDIVKEYRKARAQIGLVPQEISANGFDYVLPSVRFSRGLFGKPHNPEYLEQVMRELSLWDKRDNRIIELSGGMKRRLMIAKALSHEPRILFLDEPTAGVDVELRRDMWDMVHRLRQNGTTIILTTHYIEEAEEMADRVGVINKGEIVLVEEKDDLMAKLGKRQLTLVLRETLTRVPSELSGYDLALAAEGHELVYTFDANNEQSGISELIDAVQKAGLEFRDLRTNESSLEEIFVNLVREQDEETSNRQLKGVA